MTGFAEMVAFLTLSDRFASAPFEIAWLASHACQALFAGLLIHNRISLLKPQDYADDLSAFAAFYRSWMESGRNATWGWGGLLALATAGAFAASQAGFGEARVVVADVLAATAVIISMFALGRTGRVFDRFAELVHADAE
jgi:cation transport ATPase